MSGVDHFTSPPYSDTTRQVLQAPAARDDSTSNLFECKLGSCRCHNKVGAERKLASAGIGETLDGGDYRHGKVPERSEGLFDQLMLLPPLIIAHAVAFFEIAARRERAVPRAREHHA